VAALPAPALMFSSNRYCGEALKVSWSISACQTLVAAQDQREEPQAGARFCAFGERHEPLKQFLERIQILFLCRDRAAFRLHGDLLMVLVIGD
jgi:hypothetical protein